MAEETITAELDASPIADVQAAGSHHAAAAQPVQLIQRLIPVERVRPHRTPQHLAPLVGDKLEAPHNRTAALHNPTVAVADRTAAVVTNS
jgi:hypothetical protein